MTSGERGQRPQFAMPVQQALMMALVVGFVIVGAYTAYGFVEPIFLANRYLNGLILGVFFIGVLACFWQVAQIVVSVVWIESFLSGSRREGPLRLLTGKPPRLLAPLAGMLGTRSSLSQISTASARSILDTVASRLDEARDISRYLSNLLIFLGLLGTFFGLAITVPAVIETIRSLAPAADEEGVQVFSRLLSGLEQQLGGMGTAFSSSLIGLAGSLVVGLLDLFAGHGQNRFYRELEEWISGITKVGFGQSLIDADGGDRPLTETAVAALMEHLSELHDMLSRAEDERERTMRGVADLTEAVAALAVKLERQTEIQEERYRSGPPVNEALNRLAASQTEIAELLSEAAVGFSDEESRMLLRNIDVQLLRISEDNVISRQDVIEQVRGEINALTMALRGQGTRGAVRSQERQEGADRRGNGE